MTTNPSLCNQCGKLCPRREKFCSDRCFDAWVDEQPVSDTIHTGYSLIAGQTEVLSQNNRASN